jgi:cysteine sulfinate desulfinase/cysteine desulfurase-like protein/rhodanese-related sulfurtransferase
MLPQEIYLDANATTPVLPAAAAAAQQVMGQAYGNPSSSHSAGLNAKALLDAARERARRLLGAGDGRLLFTSGATESLQTAVLSALCALRERRQAGQAIGGLLLYGATEHKAVPESLAHWNRLLGLNLELRALPVDRQGRHDLALLRAWGPDAAMVSTMAANNETGAVSDLGGIEATLQQAGSPAYWVVDCVQALGKLPLELARTRIDYAAFSGHKLYAPKGVGMLYVRQGAPYTALMAGGGQEAGARAGTENMAGIAALGAVLAALEDGATFRTHAQLQAFRQQLADSLGAAFPGLVFNTPLDNALPTTLNFAVPQLSSKELLDVFDAAGLRVSAGSACSASKPEPSTVLQAMGLTDWQCRSAVRLSFGPAADQDFIQAACAGIARAGAALRAGKAATSQPDQPLPLDDALAPALPEEQFSLDWAGLPAFLRGHPQAQLVDVREASESLASAITEIAGRAVRNIPLSRLSGELPQWRQQAPGPLVFFCRSGNRSAKAAQCLRRLGFEQAWHLAGGLASASAMTPARHVANA